MNGLSYNKNRNEAELGGRRNDCRTHFNGYNAEQWVLHSISLHIVLDTNQNVECLGVLFFT